MSIRILLVDDHRMLREGLRSILESECDLEVVGEAEDGRTTVGMAGKLVPDVVIMDVGMSGLNGVDATRQIKAQNPRVSVIALSMYSDKCHLLSMLEAGG